MNAPLTSKDVIERCPNHVNRQCALPWGHLGECRASETSGDVALRRLLAIAYSGPNLYRDDGEFQDGSSVPVIDFLRDPVHIIENKMQERGLRAIAETAAKPAECRRERCGPISDGSWECNCAPETKAPHPYLVNATRFRLSFNRSGYTGSFYGYHKELDGRWVALVPAEDNCHMRGYSAVKTNGNETGSPT